MVRTYNIALIGFGNVGRTFVSLLERKRELLARDHHLEVTITGITTRRLGWLVNPEGFLPAQVLADKFKPSESCDSLQHWLVKARPDVVFETTSLDPHHGQPAIDHLRAALEYGAHAITANKGPVVHAYQELTGLATKMRRKFAFESSVMDGAPIFNLFRECLPAIELQGFRGILNSTTNVILESMEKGYSFDNAVRYAQQIGVAETDPSHDIDGWDAAVKVAALVTVLMGHPLKPEQVIRQGIRGITPEQIRLASAKNRRYKLVCAAQREGDAVTASVALEEVPTHLPLAQVSGTSSLVCFRTDVLPELWIHEVNPGLDAVAYGLLTDFLRAVKD